MLMLRNYLIARFMDKIRILDNIEHITDVGETFELSVSGYSMLPLLGYGQDKVIVRRVDVAEQIQNRIAMFRSERGQIIVHRVIKEGDIVVLRGDGNLYGCEYCPRNEIIGVVDGVVRRDGKVVDCTTSLWRLRENIWLGQPLFIRRCALAVIRRWLEFKKR